MLPKNGCKKIKKGLEFVEEMKELTFLQIENGKNNLIKPKNDLIERFKKNDRRKKADKEYYEYEEKRFYDLKDIRNLFNENDDDDNYEGTECLFDESIMYYSFKNNALEYEEIEKSVKPKKELIECVVTKGIIEQEYAVDYDVNYYRVNYRRCEKLQEIDYIKFKESRNYTIDYEEINDEKVKYCTIIEVQKVESYELIEEKYVEIIESCEIIEDQEDNNQLIEDKIVENDFHQLIELIEDQEDINELNEDLEIILNSPHQLIKETIESCELIEDQEDINELNEYLEIIFNNPHQLIKEIIESCELIEDQEDVNELNEYLEITFNESPFKSLI